MNSPENRPNQGNGKPSQKGAPDLRDLMHHEPEVSPVSDNTAQLDIQALMNEIRRVPTMSVPTPVRKTPQEQPSQDANHVASKPQPAAAPRRAPVSRPAVSRPVPEDDDEEEEEMIQPAYQRRTASQTARIRNQKLAAKRRRVSILLAITVVLFFAAIGTAIFFAVTHFMSKGETSSTTQTQTSLSSLEQTTEVTEQTESTTSETTLPEATPTPSVTPFPAGGPALNGYCVVIDPGHQAVANKDPESMSSSMGGSKQKSSQGYIGTVSGTDESEINLAHALLLKNYLESLGCEVYLTRDTNEVDISNKERAEYAVSKNPDVYIRLYCNAANDSKTSGCEVIVPSSGDYASQVTAWGDTLGKKISECTGCMFNGCKASGNYSGLNWASSVPSFMVRMGYLTNSDDEANLLDEEYQFKQCQAIADFVSTMAQR